MASGRESLIEVMVEQGNSMGLTRLSETVDRLGALCRSLHGQLRIGRTMGPPFTLSNPLIVRLSPNIPNISPIHP